MPFHDTPDPTPTKHCPKCNTTKPATTQYFQRNKGKRDGLQSWCKECRAERAREDYAANPGKNVEYKLRWNAANKERIRDNLRANRAANYERHMAWTRAYYKANRERDAPRDRAYKIANREHYAEYHRVYNMVNKERVKKRRRRYYAANKEVWQAAKRRRRARELNAEGSHTTADIKAQYKRQRGCCHWCGVKVGETYHVDHIIPLSRGGSDNADNLVIACPTCNRSKHDKLPHEWPQGGRLL